MAGFVFFLNMRSGDQPDGMLAAQPLPVGHPFILCRNSMNVRKVCFVIIQVFPADPIRIEKMRMNDVRLILRHQVVPVFQVAHHFPRKFQVDTAAAFNNSKPLTYFRKIILIIKNYQQ